MLQLFTARSPVVFKILIALEELGLSFESHPIDVPGGGQLDPAYKKVNPNSRVPALLDTEPADGGPPFPIFESGAILIYLAEKHGRFLPTEMRARSQVLQWVMWQMSGLGPTMGQARHFRHFSLGDQDYSVTRFTNEATRLFSVLDKQLEGKSFVCGEEYTIADICCWPWLLYSSSNGQDMESFANLSRWFKAVGERPAVMRVAERWWKDIPIESAMPLDEKTRAILFNRTR